MANREHLARLKEGKEAWNRWREESWEVADLSGADLSSTNFSRFNLSLARFDDTSFENSSLGHTRIFGSSFRRSPFRVGSVHTAFTSCSFNGAKFSGSALIETQFIDCDLDGCDFTDARFALVTFANTSLKNVRGLDAVHHLAPTSIGIDTLIKSPGLSEDFLRGCGLPEEFITFAHSLVTRPIEYYSCFLSYSSRDDAFARKLHADLQARNVRTWFAPEDLKIGDRFRDRIEDSIRLHDKLILVLSESSIGSAWVRREVEAAFEREDREKREVLFPIRLDDSVFHTDQAWARDVRRTRHIGDFTASYGDALERLIRDLRAENARAPRPAAL
jgi:uncharacterized protein YjbI with pentapeptide repeats